MDDIYVYFVELPPKINEIVMPCCGGYTIYIDSRLTWEKKKEMYDHALSHIKNMDFEKVDVQAIEHDAHKSGKGGLGQ